MYFIEQVLGANMCGTHDSIMNILAKDKAFNLIKD